MPRLQRNVSPLVVSVLSLSATLLSPVLLGADDEAEARSVVRVQLPNDFPVGLPAPVAGTLEGSAPESTQFILKPTQGRRPAVPGQLDPASGKVWFFWQANNREPGTTLSFKVLPLDSAPIARVREQSDGFQFYESDRPVLFYQREPKSQEGKFTRAGYVHPLLGLDGELISEDFSEDHPHQRGVFWAWHQLLVGGRAVGDPWVTTDHLTLVRNAGIVAQGPVFATLVVDAVWTSPLSTDSSGNERPLVEERTTIRMFRSTAGSQPIDFEVALRALVPDVKIGGAEAEVGYGGFTVRVKPPGDMILSDAIGTLSEDRIQQASPWADASGHFGPQLVSGVSILSHPSLPEFPPKWVLRHYGMQNVAYPGRYAVPLSQDEPLVLRHRVLVHRGDAQAARTPEQQRVYELSE